MKNILYTIILSFLFSFNVFAESARGEYIDAAMKGTVMVGIVIIAGYIIMLIHRLLRYIFRKLFNINFDLSGLVPRILNYGFGIGNDEIDKEKVKFEQIDDEHIYEKVAKETKRQGLWLKAKTESGGDEAKAEALYTKKRVSEIKKAEQEQLDKKVEVEQEKLDQERLEQERKERPGCFTTFANFIVLTFFLLILSFILLKQCH